MILDALIAKLEALKAEHGGDLPVRVDDGDDDTAVVPAMVRHGYDEDGGDVLVIDLTAH